VLVVVVERMAVLAVLAVVVQVQQETMPVTVSQAQPTLVVVVVVQEGKFLLPHLVKRAEVEWL
jgi:hypothetical protein